MNDLCMRHHIRVILTYSGNDPGNGLSHLPILVLKHGNKLVQARDNHIHELLFIGTLSNGSQSEECCISALPVGGRNISTNKCNDRFHHRVANYLRNDAKAAPSRQSNTPLITILILIFNVNFLYALYQQLN
jgi:hypothetical protein